MQLCVVDTGIHGGDDKPRGNTHDDAEHTKHQHLRILLESHGIADLALNGARYTASHEERTSELENARDHHRISHRNSVSTH